MSLVLTEAQTPGTYVREQRLERGLTQKDLAERCGMYQADISALENNHAGSGLTVHAVRRLAYGLEPADVNKRTRVLLALLRLGGLDESVLPDVMVEKLLSLDFLLADDLLTA